MLGKRPSCRDPSVRQSQTYCSRWLRGVYAARLKPEMRILEIVPAGGNWIAAEQRWIAHYRSRTRLTNLTIGGEGLTGWKHSDAFRQLISLLSSGRKMSAEARLRMREAWTPERRAALSLRVRGSTMSEEARQKMRASSAKRDRSKETYIRAAPYLPISDDQKKKLSVALKASWARRRAAVAA